MTLDMMHALNTFQDMWDHEIIETKKGVLHPEATVYADKDTGVSRLTYTLIEDDTVLAIAVAAQTDPLKGKVAFQVGWAVLPARRGEGLAKKIAQITIEEMDAGFRRANTPMFYIEASVDAENAPSLAVAKSVFGDPVETGTDKRTDKDVVLYRVLKGKRPFEV